ncbi:hypothetical protein [Prevotella denticola]|nr:hypothetical protein [Prevotella denticola]
MASKIQRPIIAHPRYHHPSPFIITYLHLSSPIIAHLRLSSSTT